MSHILKALQKAHKEGQAGVHKEPVHAEKNEAQVLGHSEHHAGVPVLGKPMDMQVLFMGVLILLASAGVYLNYTISMKLASTQTGMLAISDNFRAQDERLNKMNDLIVRIDSVNSGQNKEFVKKIDALSSSMVSQIADVQKLSKSQYSDLSKTIDEQQKSIEILTNKYDRLEKSVSNYADVNSHYVEQVNMLKKKLADISSAQAVEKRAVKE